MNWDRVEGNWKQVTGKVKEKWGKLTDDDLTVINGKQDQLVGRVQERYGIAKDEAERQVKEWADRHVARRAAKAKTSTVEKRGSSAAFVAKRQSQRSVSSLC